MCNDRFSSGFLFFDFCTNELGLFLDGSDELVFFFFSNINFVLNLRCEFLGKELKFLELDVGLILKVDIGLFASGE